MREYQALSEHKLPVLMRMIQKAAGDGFHLVTVVVEPNTFEDEPAGWFTAFMERDHVPCCAVCNKELVELTQKEQGEQGESHAPKSRSPKSTSILPPGFLKVWAAYPAGRRISRKMCLNLWTRGDHENDAEYILTHLEACKKSAQWQDESKIPHASTYINQVRWQEEAPKALAAPPELPFADQIVKDDSGHWVTQMTLAVARRALGRTLTKQQEEIVITKVKP